MVPTFIHQIGEWLDRFSDVLDRWEATLAEVEEAYAFNNLERLRVLCESGEAIHLEITQCKKDRELLLQHAIDNGMKAHTLRELSSHLAGVWPALWTHRITQMELQLNRVQRLSMNLWVSAFQSQSMVSEMLLVLATGRTESATYSPSETQSSQGGFIINEAA